jgi:hypothetical protein
MCEGGGCAGLGSSLLVSDKASTSPTRLIREYASAEKRSCMKIVVMVSIVDEVVLQEMGGGLAKLSPTRRKPDKSCSEKIN